MSREEEELRHRLAEARRQAAYWQHEAEAHRARWERLRRHPVVDIVYRLLQSVAPLLRMATAGLARGRSLTERAMPAARRRFEVMRARTSLHERERRLSAVIESGPTVDKADPRRVAVLVLTAGRSPVLGSLVQRLARMVGDATITVVVNGVDPDELPPFPAGVELRSLPAHHTFAAAYDEAIRATSADVVCLLNDDVVPLRDDWLARMLVELRDEVAAVGAQLVHPRDASRHIPLSVQHLGIELLRGGPDGIEAANISREAPVVAEPHDVAAVTAACVVLDRDRYLAIGGFDLAYDFGAEDVDLCVRLRGDGGRIRIVPAVVFTHAEGTTRHQADRGLVHARQRRNWVHFRRVHGPALWHELWERDVLDGGLHIAITATRLDVGTGYGDVVVARDLGDALRALGHRVTLLERHADRWYEPLPSPPDVVVSLHDLFDVRRVARPGTTTIAWIRNWVDRWVTQPWFADYDLVLGAGPDVAERLAGERGGPVGVLRPATSGRPVGTTPPRSGVVLPVNSWGPDRGVEALLRAIPSARLVGTGWDGVGGVVAQRWDGAVASGEISELYARSEVVVDVGSPHTAGLDVVNTRVLDAAAAGAMVVTDRAATRELVHPDVAVFDSLETLEAVVGELLADPDATRRRAERVARTVLAEHTFAQRADELVGHLVAHGRHARFVIFIGASDAVAARHWGDLHLAEAMARHLRARGHPTTVLARDAWESPAAELADVRLHVRGRFRAPTAPGRCDVVWLVSHPDELTDDEAESADLVLVASPMFADRLRMRADVPVGVLLQATDTRRFRPRPALLAWRAPVGFVGNSRHVRRPIVDAAVHAGLEPVVVGDHWEGLVPSHLVRSSFVPNDQVPDLYSSFDVLLNDHWRDMRDHGFVSNRVYDALACGTVVVSDEVEGLRELAPAVVTVPDLDNLRPVVEALLRDPEDLAARGQAGVEIVRSQHTFEHRVDDLLDQLRPLLPERLVVAGRA